MENNTLHTDTGLIAEKNSPEKKKTPFYKDRQFWVGVVLVVALIEAYRCFFPFRAEWYYREGYNLEAGKQFEKAAKSMEKAVRLAPLETFYGVTLGKIYETLAQKASSENVKIAWADKADAIYTRILEISPLNPWYHNRKAEMYRFYASLEKDPQKRDALIDKSDEKIKYAATLDKNNALFQMSLAYLYHRSKEYDKAMALYERVLEIDPKFSEAYFNMGDIWRQRGRIDKTIELYEKIISTNPAFSNAHLNLGRIYYSQGKLKKAEEEFIKEIKKNKQNVAAYQSLGALLTAKKNWPMAIRVYNRVLQLNPQDILSRQYLAQSYYSLGMLEEAIAELEQVLALRPDDAAVKRNIELMRTIKNRGNQQPVRSETPQAEPAKDSAVKEGAVAPVPTEAVQ